MKVTPINSLFFARSLLLVLVIGLSGCRLFFFGGSTSWRSADDLRDAEEYIRSERYDEAIEAYRRHIDTRLAVKSRPEWENPWFYLLMIGDTYLQKADPSAAIESYMEAHRRGVEEGLVSDRVRMVSGWFEKRGDLRKAIEVLQSQRALDPLLFDASLDRLSRLLTLQEDSDRSPTPTPLATIP